MAKKPTGNARDAGSGQFVTKKYAANNPKTTVVESAPGKSSGKPAASKPGKKG